MVTKVCTPCTATKTIIYLIETCPKITKDNPFLIAYTVSSGIGQAGVQVGDVYGYWTRIHDQLVLVQPNLEVKINWRLNNRKVGTTESLQTE